MYRLLKNLKSSTDFPAISKLLERSTFVPARAFFPLAGTNVDTGQFGLHLKFVYSSLNPFLQLLEDSDFTMIAVIQKYGRGQQNQNGSRSKNFTLLPSVTIERRDLFFYLRQLLHWFAYC